MTQDLWNMYCTIAGISGVAVGVTWLLCIAMGGEMRKGGINREPSKVVTRPQDPASMRAKPYPFDHIRKLELKDGDLVVINVDQRLTLEQCERIKANITTVTDKLGHKVMAIVLDKGMELSVVSKADIENTVIHVPEPHPDAACDWYIRHKHIA
ncbi:hypothetical protein QFZ34_002073 [Phyllobacterium ifriqiyense]|uniref:Uncharacterized protein n=1 Tax=Phyllobacterium ifriqiyense TaxID=314238 RepID=A0ABU0S8U0_9HYPH|nr:hypothetical protein [Phyllobacterium ifriqiyense]MDQ0996891.1 hypothetical protein [Phyllobacterium ifriqiyense]